MRTVHACALVLTVDARQRGVLIEGPSGSGKTSLSAALLAGHRSDRLARLVADDRVVLRVSHGRLISAPPAAIAGIAEVPFGGVVRVAHLGACIVDAVVRLDATHPLRVPVPAHAGIAGEGGSVRLPLLRLAPGRTAASAAAVRAWLRDGALPLGHGAASP